MQGDQGDGNGEQGGMRILAGHGVRFEALSCATGRNRAANLVEGQAAPGNAVGAIELQQTLSAQVRHEACRGRFVSRRRQRVRPAQTTVHRKRAASACRSCHLRRRCRAWVAQHPSKSPPRSRARSRQSGDRRSRWSSTTASPTRRGRRLRARRRGPGRQAELAAPGRQPSGAPTPSPRCTPTRQAFDVESRASSIQWQQQCRAATGTGNGATTPILTGCYEQRCVGREAASVL